MSIHEKKNYHSRYCLIWDGSDRGCPEVHGLDSDDGWLWLGNNGWSFRVIDPETSFLEADI